MRQLLLSVFTVLMLTVPSFAALPDPDTFSGINFIHWHLNTEIETQDTTAALAWLGKMGLGVRFVFPRAHLQTDNSTTIDMAADSDYPEGYDSSIQDFEDADVPMIWGFLDANSNCGAGNEQYWSSETGAECLLNYVEGLAKYAGDNHPTHVVAFELWNEPNLSFWYNNGAGGSVADLCEYATAAQTAIATGWAASTANGAYPVPPLMGPSTSGTIAANNFGQQVLELCGDSFDVITHHNYFSKNPSSSQRTPGLGGMRGQFATLDTIHTAEDTLGQPIPRVLGMTEGFGVDTYNNNPFDYQDQVEMAPNSYIICAYSRYSICGMYSVTDSRNVDNQTSDKHYGWYSTTGADFEKTLTAKPVLERLELMFTALNGWQVVRNFDRNITNMDDYGRLSLSGSPVYTTVDETTRRIDTDGDWTDVFAFLYFKGGKIKLVVFHERGGQVVQLPSISSFLGTPLSGTTADTTQYYATASLQIIDLKGVYALPGDQP